MKSNNFTIEKLTPHCGALVVGLDLSQPLASHDLDTLKQALAEHCVLFFRDQALTPVQQKTLGCMFGDLHIHPAWPRIVKGHPQVMEIYSDENTKRIAGEDWHTDVSCDPKPPMGTILQMLEVPPVGGDTLFASMYAVYDSLSTAMQQFLAGMTAVHDGNIYHDRYEGGNTVDKSFPQSEHPIVCKHPVNSQPYVFVNRIFTSRIVQLTKHESDAVLQMLFARIEHAEFQCRFHWQPGSVAFWDNRCAQHRALWDYYPHRRRGLRVTINGGEPQASQLT